MFEINALETVALLIHGIGVLAAVLAFRNEGGRLRKILVLLAALTVPLVGPFLALLLLVLDRRSPRHGTVPPAGTPAGS